MRLGTSKSFFIQILFFLEHKHQDCKLSSFGHVCSLWTEFANGGLCWHFAVVFFLKLLFVLFFVETFFFLEAKIMNGSLREQHLICSSGVCSCEQFLFLKLFLDALFSVFLHLRMSKWIFVHSRIHLASLVFCPQD